MHTSNPVTHTHTHTVEMPPLLCGRIVRVQDKMAEKSVASPSIGYRCVVGTSCSCVDSARPGRGQPDPSGGDGDDCGQGSSTVARLT